MKAEVQYYPSAKWASLNGAFTSEELREIADKIDGDNKEFTEQQKG